MTNAIQLLKDRYLKNIKEKVLYFLDVRSASVHNMTQVFEWHSPICTTASLPWGGVQSYVLCKKVRVARPLRNWPKAAMRP